MTRAAPAPLLAVALLAGGAAAAGAQAPTQAAKLVAADAQPAALLGRAVDLDRDTALAGARYDDHAGGVDAGAGYVFVRGGTAWTQQAKLVAADPGPGRELGAAAALDGDTVALGAPLDDHLGGADAGAVYVFVRTGTTWTQQARLVARDPTVDARFGEALVLAGDTLVVGAPGDTHAGGAGAGSVYVFERAGGQWTQRAKRTAADAAPAAAFGAAVALDGDTLLVGASGDAAGAGAGYVFERSGTAWTQTAKLLAGDAAASDALGSSAALDGSFAVLGAPSNTLAAGQPGGPMGEGTVYVFARAGSTWAQRQRLVASNAGGGAGFGVAVDLDGDTLVAGAPLSDEGAGSGTAYVFTTDGVAWSEATTLRPDGPGDDREFASGVATSRARALFGAPLDTGDGGTYAGAAVVFDLNDGDVLTYCAGKTSSAGCVPFVGTTGVPSATATAPFRITAHDVVPSEAGVLLYAGKKGQLAFHGALLCVKAPFVRTPAKAAVSTGGGCSGWRLRRNFNAVVQAGGDPALTAGGVVHAQWRQRDPADPAGFGDGLSDAVRFVILP